MAEMTPAKRRELWLSVALAVARDGLPAPERCTIRTANLHFVDLDFERVAEATRWAEALKLPAQDVIKSRDGEHRLYRWSDERAGVWWALNSAEPVTAVAAAEDLAAQVVDAIAGDAEVSDR